MPVTDQDRAEAGLLRAALSNYAERVHDNKASRINDYIAILYKAAETEVAFSGTNIHSSIVAKIHELAVLVDTEWVSPLVDFFHRRHAELCRRWSADSNAAPA